MGLVKGIIGFILVLWIITEMTPTPAWAQLISFSLIIAGAVAHSDS